MAIGSHLICSIIENAAFFSNLSIVEIPTLLSLNSRSSSDFIGFPTLLRFLSCFKESIEPLLHSVEYNLMTA